MNKKTVLVTLGILGGLGAALGYGYHKAKFKHTHEDGHEIEVHPAFTNTGMKVKRHKIVIGTEDDLKKIMDALENGSVASLQIAVRRAQRHARDLHEKGWHKLKAVPQVEEALKEHHENLKDFHNTLDDISGNPEATKALKEKLQSLIGYKDMKTPNSNEKTRVAYIDLSKAGELSNFINENFLR